MLFSVAKRAASFQQDLQDYREGENRDGGVGGGVGQRGEERRCKVKVISDRLNRTGDRIAPLKIQSGQKLNVSVASR